MSFYFKLKDKVYKVSNKVTIGRGAPFDDLCLNRDVSRTHCKIQNKKGNFYIQSLCSKSHTYVNGTKVPFSKWVQISINDKILIGDQSLEIVENYAEKDYLPLRSFYSSIKKYSNFNYLQKWLLVSGFVFISVVSFVEQSSLVFTLVSSLVLGAMSATLWHLQAKYVGSNDEIVVNEVVIGNSGLTLHYRNTNMSMKYVDMDHVYMKHKAIFIHSHNETYVVHQLKNIDELFNLILKQVPLSARNSKPSNNKEGGFYPVTLIGSLVAANLYIYILHKGLGQESLMVSVSCLLLLSISLLFKRSPLESLSNSKTKDSIRKKSKFVGLVTLGLCLMNFFEYRDISDQEVKLAKCLSTNVEFCNQIDYNVLMSALGHKSKAASQLITKVCNVDEVACGKIKKERSSRSIASESEQEN
jgi:hypothetical protein